MPSSVRQGEVSLTVLSAHGPVGSHSGQVSFCRAQGASALGPVLVADDAAALCVAGVALGDIHLRFAWQAWHHLTFTLVLRGRRGTHGTGWLPWAHFSRG